MKFLNNKIQNNNRGTILVVAMLMTGLFMAMAMGAIGLSLLQQKLNIMKISSNQALHIAEAGIDYYHWVLYHTPDDYCNGETCVSDPENEPYGPYNYLDANDNLFGQYELYITPPPTDGSTIVKIKSVGWEKDHPNIKRTIEVQLGIPSWANFSTLSNDVVLFDVGSEIWGPVHSNTGVRIDGIAHGLVTSAAITYNDPDHTENPSDVIALGVHTHKDAGVGTYDEDEEDDPVPTTVPEQNEVFLAGRSFPVPIVSFDLLDSYVSDMYTIATSGGMLIDPQNSGVADSDSESAFWGCINNTCDEGFHITLKNNNTFDIKGVSAVHPMCNNNPDAATPSLSIATENSIGLGNYPIPTNGIIFVKNNVWIDGIASGTRVTVLAFIEPFTTGNANIIINNDLLYNKYDGSDSIGLVSQNNIGPGLHSQDILRVDAAMIAKNGRVMRQFYKSSCHQDTKRESITIFGSLSTKQRYNLKYRCGIANQFCSGYDNVYIIFDNNMTYSPPPHFPTTGEYVLISWKED